MIKFIKKYIGELVTLIGVAMTSYNIFGLFDFKKLKSESHDITILKYIYSETQTILITIGIVLIVMGILIIKNRK